LIVNFLLFQLGWFASVLGAARESPWLGVGVVVVVVVVHLALRATPRELALIATSAGMGLAMDSFLVNAGLVHYRSPTPVAWLAPVWIVAMWANFAITLRHSLAWLERRCVLAAILGAVFGPLAYWGASRLGAAEMARPVVASAVLALIWGAGLPALFWISAKYR
jgi:hypothetical protein